MKHGVKDAKECFAPYCLPLQTEAIKKKNEIKQAEITLLVKRIQWWSMEDILERKQDIREQEPYPP